MCSSEAKPSLPKRLALLATSVLVALVVLELGLRFAGFAVVREQRRANAAPTPDEAVRILCLGESTTQNGPAPWPEQLEHYLNAHSSDRSFRVFNGGVGGTTTALILARLERQLAQRRPHVVITMMGINDRLFGAGARFDDRPPKVTGLARLRVVKLMGVLSSALRARLAPDAARTKPARRPAEWVRDIEHAADSLLEGERTHPERVLRAALAQGVPSAEAYWALAFLARAREHDLESVRLLEQAVELAPERSRYFAELAALHRTLGEDAAADRAHARFLHLEHINPRVDALREQANERLRASDDLDDATAVLAEALEIAPDRIDLLIDLATLHQALDRRETAQDLLLRAEKQAPGALAALDLAARPYLPSAARGPEVPVTTRRQDLSAPPGRVRFLMELSRIQLALDHPVHAAHSVARALALSPAADGTLVALEPVRLALDVDAPEIERIYAELGYPVLAHLSRAQAEDVEVTREHYRAVNRMLTEHGIRHVAMQYATLPLSELRELLGPNLEVTLVANEQNFARALTEHGFDALFNDHFGGGFGHATALGNRLLAEAAGAVILENEEP